MQNEIIRPWVKNLSLRFQGTLLTAIRGCDLSPKHSPEKMLLREMRALILIPFDPRELEYLRGFMIKFGTDEAEKGFQEFAKSMDQFPLHFVMHLLHAIEIIGYKHFSSESDIYKFAQLTYAPHKMSVSEIYEMRYKTLCRKFHVNPETESQLDARMEENRIENKTVES
jgi:hypothetical protein